MEDISLREVLELQRHTLEVLKQALELLSSVARPVYITSAPSLGGFGGGMTTPNLPYPPATSPLTAPSGTWPLITCQGGIVNKSE